MKRKVIGVLTAGLLIGGTAVAEEPTSGFYAGVGIGKVSLKDTELGITVDAEDTGFRLLGGYQINQNFAVELAYIDGGTPDDTIQGVRITVDADGFEGALKGSVPFNQHFSGFAKAGILSWDSTVSATDGFNFASADADGNDFVWALGLEMTAGQKANIRLEYEGADLAGTDYRMLSLGASWRF